MLWTLFPAAQIKRATLIRILAVYPHSDEIAIRGKMGTGQRRFAVLVYWKLACGTKLAFDLNDTRVGEVTGHFL